MGETKGFSQEVTMNPTGKLWVSSLVGEALEFLWPRSLVGGICR